MLDAVDILIFQYQELLNPAMAASRDAYVARPAFAYSPSLHSLHARRDRVAPLPLCRLYGAAMRRTPHLGWACA